MYKSTLVLLSVLIFSISFAKGQSVATYDITFTSIWNATDHTSIPGNAHWSKLVGATHQTVDVFLKEGSLATTGIKNIAETGNNTVFNTEVNTQINAGEADQYIDGPSLGSATGDMVISNLQVSEDYPLLTLVSMIAPSPDWMIAINGCNLLDAGGAWKPSVSIDMYAYDAGTDDGVDYTSANVVSNPFQPISMINSAPINGNKIGTLTITLDNVTGVNEVGALNRINVYPNPASGGTITIQNMGGTLIREVQLFNSVGSLSKAQNNINHNEKIFVDISDLSPGIYFMKIIADTNRTVTRKLVIK